MTDNHLTNLYYITNYHSRKHIPLALLHGHPHTYTHTPTLLTHPTHRHTHTTTILNQRHLHIAGSVHTTQT